jgi:molecular chaperone DnaJ
MDYYSILNVNKDASKEDIKKSYKKLAMEFHPDKHMNKPDHERASLEDRFKKINEAYGILGDDTKRQQYDNPQQGNPFNFFGGSPFGGNNPFGGNSPFGVFNMFTNMHQQQSEQTFPIQKEEVRLKDIDYTIKVTLEELYNGKEVNLRINQLEKCSCLKECDVCKGYGEIAIVKNMGIIRQQIKTNCKKCFSRGFMYLPSGVCGICNNNGFIDKLTDNKIQVPKGVDKDWSFKFLSKGQQKKKPNEISGDLIIKLEIIPHEYLKKEGLNLIYECNITFLESIVGKQIIIKKFNDEEYKLNLSDYGIINPNKNIEIENQGFRDEKGNIGKLIIKINIDYPSFKLSDIQKQQITESLKDIV